MWKSIASYGTTCLSVSSAVQLESGMGISTFDSCTSAKRIGGLWDEQAEMQKLRVELASVKREADLGSLQVSSQNILLYSLPLWLAGVYNVWLQISMLLLLFVIIVEIFYDFMKDIFYDFSWSSSITTWHLHVVLVFLGIFKAELNLWALSRHNLNWKSDFEN